MKQHIIPKEIKQKAGSLGFNSVGYSGHIDGADAYSVGVVNKDGSPCPMGLPTFILDREGQMSIVSGVQGLELHLRLQEP